jgi:Zn-dependent peptidase ImmA (M78 family)/transcriptional regulator with XRE-family HTH domain
VSEGAVEVGQRIRTLRERRGWSQAEVAARMGCTQTAVSYWEAGRRALRLDELLALARVLGVSPAELLPRTPQQRRPIPTLLRAVAEQVDAAQLADELERFAVRAQLRPRPATRWHIAAASPRDTAEALLEAASVTSPPIPIGDLVAGCGVLILPWSFENVDGLVVDLDDGVAIGINSAQSSNRRRFTLGHELGHYLLGHTERFHVDFGGDLSSTAIGEHPDYDWRAERDANDFAANLLMPAPMLRHEYSTTQDVASLATRFRVSPSAMGYRLASLRLGLKPS